MGACPDLTDEGKRRSKLMKSDDLPGQTFDWVDDFDSWDRCITRGMPASMFTINYNNGIRVWQSPGLVAIQLEMVQRQHEPQGAAGLGHHPPHVFGDRREHFETPRMREMFHHHPRAEKRSSSQPSPRCASARREAVAGKDSAHTVQRLKDLIAFMELAGS